METYRPVKDWGFFHCWVIGEGGWTCHPVGLHPSADEAMCEARGVFGAGAMQVVETIPARRAA